MITVLQLAQAIHARLTAGEAPLVEVVRLDGGGLVVRWGVAGLTLQCKPEGARDLAAAFGAADYQPDLAELLIDASDACASGRLSEP